MAKKTETIHLLIVDASSSDADFLASELRNAGISVKPFVVENADALEQIVEDKVFDLILCAMHENEDEVKKTCDLMNEVDSNIPIIAVTHDTDTAAVIRAMEAGASDLVNKNQPEHLKQVLQREMRNISSRKKVEQYRKANEESEKRCRTLLDSSRDAIAYVHAGMHIYANAIYLDMFGHKSMDDLEGLPILDLVAEEDHGTFKEFLSLYDKGKNKGNTIEVKGVRDDDTEFIAQMEFSLASIEGEPCTQIIIRDKTISQEVMAELNVLRNQDIITGLQNRKTFLEELQQAIVDSAHGESPASIIYIEIDNFNDIKEMLGIGGTDEALKSLGEIIQGAIDKTEIPARFGDNIFTILTRNKDPKRIKAMAEVIRSSTESKIIEVDKHSTSLTCSIGIANVPQRNITPYEALALANFACDKAVEAGGNRIEVYKAEKQLKSLMGSDLTWVERIKSAMEENRMRLSFQPIIGLAEEEEERFEVLLRMIDEQGEIVRPGEFLSAAHNTGMINMIDQWVIGRAIYILTKRDKVTTSFMIKISGASCAEEKLLPWVYQKIKAAKINPSRLIFEITYDDATSRLKDVQKFCHIAKKMRCRISINRFGRDKNPFKILKHINADFLKSDPTLSEDLITNSGLQEKLKALNKTAMELGKIFVVPRIEDASSMSVVFACGIQYVQGNFLAEPGITLEHDFKAASREASGFYRAVE